MGVPLALPQRTRRRCYGVTKGGNDAVMRSTGGGACWERSCLRLAALAVVATASASACSGDDCSRPPIGAVALSIQVVDSESGAPICDAAVVIQRADESWRLPSGCRYSGGSEAGIYKITVTRTGYQDKVVADVEVTADTCSYAVNKQVTIDLIPSSA